MKMNALHFGAGQVKFPKNNKTTKAFLVSTIDGFQRETKAFNNDIKLKSDNWNDVMRRLEDGERLECIRYFQRNGGTWPSTEVMKTGLIISEDGDYLSISSEQDEKGLQLLAAARKGGFDLDKLSNVGNDWTATLK